MKKSILVLIIVLLLGALTTTVFAGSLATESGDWAYPNAPTFTAALGSQTITGSLGPTPTDGQDPFNVNIPSNLEVTSVAYSGPGGPHNLVGCGLTGTSNLNQSFSANNSGCQLSWFINTNFAEYASGWTVTIVTQNKPVPTDTEAPSWSVPANITVSATSAAGAVVNYTATASDNVGVTSSSCSPASGSTFTIGTATVTCTAADAAGNTGTASFTVTVEDTTPPNLTMPADITLAPTSAAGAVVNYTASATDNVGLATFGCVPASGSTFAIGTTTVTCTATDVAGNTATATFTVTVEDTTAPTWTVPADITEEATSASGAVVNYTASASDIVGVASSSCSPVSGSTFAIGTTPVTCTAADAAGNTGTASFNVTVEDTTAPTWTVPADITEEATSASGAVVNYTASASDIVGVASSSCSPVSGSTFAIGTTPVTCTAADAAGNTGTASFNVTVEDTIAPTWTVPADISVIATGLSGAVVSYTATPSDIVGATSSSCSPASGSTFYLGTVAVTCTAQDAAGNTGTASFNVTVGVDTGSTGTLSQGIENMGLPNGVENSLVGPVNQADRLLNDNNPSNDGAVCNKLDEFLVHVADNLAEGGITQAQADLLINFAHAIQTELGC